MADELAWHPETRHWGDLPFSTVVAEYYRRDDPRRRQGGKVLGIRWSPRSERPMDRCLPSEIAKVWHNLMMMEVGVTCLWLVSGNCREAVRQVWDWDADGVWDREEKKQLFDWKVRPLMVNAIKGLSIIEARYSLGGHENADAHLRKALLELCVRYEVYARVAQQTLSWLKVESGGGVEEERAWDILDGGDEAVAVDKLFRTMVNGVMGRFDAADSPGV